MNFKHTNKKKQNLLNGISKYKRNFSKKKGLLNLINIVRGINYTLILILRIKKWKIYVFFFLNKVLF